MATTIKEATIEFIESALKFFLIDLDALSEEQVQNSPGGSARSPIDFIHECTIVHKFMLARLSGADVSGIMANEKRDENNFIVAPEGLTKESAREAFKSSLEEIRDLVANSSDEEMMRIVKTSQGEEPFYSLAMFAAIHSNYHNGQLSQIQGLSGDGKNHWF